MPGQRDAILHFLGPASFLVVITVCTGRRDLGCIVAGARLLVRRLLLGHPVDLAALQLFIYVGGVLRRCIIITSLLGNREAPADDLRRLSGGNLAALLDRDRGVTNRLQAFARQSAGEIRSLGECLLAVPIREQPPV